MKIDTVHEDEKVYIKITGKIDTVSALDFQKEMEILIKYEVKPDIEIDCSDLEYVSSQGLRTFLLAQKEVNAKNGNLVLVNMKKEVKEVFDITGFSNIIKIL